MAIKDLDPETLQQLMLGVSLKDEKAFKTFFLHYRFQLFPFVRGIVHDNDVADQVVSDTLLFALQNLDVFEGRSQFGTWLGGIARHKALDASRAKKRREKVVAALLDEPEEMSAANDTPWLDVLAEVEASQTMRQFQRCLDALPLHQRDVAALTMVAGMTETEVAAELNCAVGTVKSRLYAARTPLQNCLRTWYEEMKRV